MTKAVPRLPDPARHANAPVFEADGKRLVLDRVLDDWGCRARDLGRVLDYAADGGKLVDKIGGAWKDEFAEGVDFIRGSSAITDSVIAGQTAPLILTRSGINLVCILTRKPLGRQIRHWLARDVMTQIADTGSYSSTLTTREADLSALTDAVSAIVPALTAITTTLAALGARVAALETRSESAPAPTTGKGKAYFDQLRAEMATKKTPEGALQALVDSGLRGQPSHGNSKVRYLAFDPADIERVTGSRSVISEWAARGWLVGEGPAHLTRKVMVVGVRKRMVCIRRDVFEAPPALPAPRRESGPFDRPALPAPRFEPPAEWNGVPVEEILNDNLHLAGAGCWLYDTIADPDATPKGTEPQLLPVFRPGVAVGGTRLHPGPGAYAWTSNDWIHVHVSADIWTAHRAGDPRATWLIGKIVDRYQTHVEALRIVEVERRKLPKLGNGKYPKVPEDVAEEAFARFGEPH